MNCVNGKDSGGQTVYATKSVLYSLATCSS